MANDTKPPLIAHVIYRLGTGGLENGLINLINHMPTDKYRHMIICLKGSTSFRERLQKQEVEIVDLQKQEGQDWRSFIRFYQILKKHKVDIVHSRNIGTIEYQVPALLAGIKYRVHGEHGWDIFDPEGNNKKYQKLRQILGFIIQVFIPLSKHLQAYLLDKVKIPSQKITRICNGVDIEKFHPSKHRQAIKNCPIIFDDKKIYLGTVGRMHGVKDQLTLVKAFVILMQQNPSLIGQVYLILVGDGPLKQPAEELLKTQQLDQYAWLAGDRQDIANIMRILDIFVLPSQAEGISNTILEAMATGLPIIATEVGGTPELVVHNENGFLVPPSNPELMSEALKKLVTNPEKRQQQGEKSIKRVHEFFSIQAMVSQYVNVYDSLTRK